MSTFKPELVSFLGALEIGVIACAFLFGALTLQVYIYYSKFASDARYLKILVFATELCEVGFIISISHALYIMSVANYGNRQLLLTPPSSIAVAYVLGSFITPIAHACFVLRVYKVSKKPYIPVIAIVLSLSSYGGNLASVVGVFRMTDLIQFVDNWTALLTFCMVTRLTADILITGTLVAHLYWWRADSEFTSTHRMIDKLIKWNLETGFIVAIANVVKLICFNTMKHNYVWFAILVMETRLFANSFLATLNSRLILGAKDDIIIIDSQFGYLSRPEIPPVTQISFARNLKVVTEITETSQV